jgi:phosphatidylglycerophosphatase A
VTRLAVFIATVGYCGYFPFAPGTIGSAAGLLFYALVWWVGSPILEVGMILTLFAVGVPAGRFEQLHGGLGVMADDAMAAVYANLSLRLLLWLVPAWIA